MYLEVRMDETEGTDVGRIARSGDRVLLDMIDEGKSWLTIVRTKGKYYAYYDGVWNDCNPGGRLKDRIDRMLGLLPDEQMLPTLRRKAAYEVPGYGTFYAEMATVEENEVIYCFDRGELQYILSKQPTVTSVYEPTLQETFPASVTELLQSLDTFLKEQK